MTDLLKTGIVFIFCLGLAIAANAEEELVENLKALKPFIGKTWKGEFKNSTPEKPVFDVSRWERALNGQAVRVLHSINNGEYGGESLIFWDKGKNSLAFYYFCTGGFYTHGTMKLENSKYTTYEFVTGDADGVTEVRATGEVTNDGRLLTKSEYLKNGKWLNGHEAVYKEDPKAQVIFK
ncbi:hypothetical protein L0222_07800 [bacterium]|nr:hypothetical protein [bacterium]